MFSKKNKRIISYVIVGLMAFGLVGGLAMDWIGSLTSKPAVQHSHSSGPLQGEYTVHFIDIGQGDSALIQQGNVNILIDAGPGTGEKQLIDYLHSKNIKTIDLCVVTHPHEDHMGGMDKVIDTFDVKEVYMTDVEASSKAYSNLLEAIAKNNVKVTKAKFPNELKVGEITLTQLSDTDKYEETNDTSIALRAEYKGTHILLTGDIEKDVEHDIVSSGQDIKADILKVGHHGSYSSSTHAFVKKIAPTWAVISCATGNTYGHPHKETLKTLEDLHIQILRTDIDGNIVFDYQDGKLVQQ